MLLFASFVIGFYQEFIMSPAMKNRLSIHAANKFSFGQKLWFLLFFFSIIITVTFFNVVYYIFSDSVVHQVSQRAVVQAREIASDPELRKQVALHYSPGVQKQVSRLQKLTDADFIVIGDKNIIRLAHPDKNKIGYKMQGGDSMRAIQKGEYYASTRAGSLGYGIRGKAPIFDKDHQVIGVVSVGYLLKNKSAWLSGYITPIMLTAIGIIIFCSFGAGLFSRYIKRSMHNLEPEELAIAIRIQLSVLQSVDEGIVAIFQDGTVINVNNRARKIFNMKLTSHYVRGQKISQYIDNTKFLISDYILDNITDELVIINNTQLIASRMKLEIDKKVIGYVLTFRLKDEVRLLNEELTQIKQYVDNLRVVKHEFANQLTTINGLLQIGHYDKAKELINSNTACQQSIIDFIQRHFNSKIITGLLIGKYSRAAELGLELKFDPMCYFENDNLCISENDLGTIIANLLSNAFEANINNKGMSVSFLMMESDQELSIIVTDEGAGISPEQEEKIFHRGFTNKKTPGHGIGLYLVHQLITAAQGMIEIDSEKNSGTTFAIYIPKKITPQKNIPLKGALS